MKSTTHTFKPIIIYWLSGLGWILLCNYEWRIYLNNLYTIFQLLTLISACVLIKNYMTAIFSKYTIFMWSLLIVLVAYYILGYGDYALKNMLSVHIRAFFGCYILGYSVSKDRKFRRYFIWGIIISYFILTSQNLYDLFVANNYNFLSGNISREIMGSALNKLDYTEFGFVGEFKNVMVVILPTYFAQLTIIFFFAFSAYFRPNLFFKKLIYVLIAIQLSLLIMIFYSTWAVSIVNLLVGMVLLVFMLPSSVTERTNIPYLFYKMLPLLVGVLFFVLSIKVFFGSDSGRTSEQISFLFIDILSGNFGNLYDGLEFATGGRIGLALVSITGFLSAPLIGHGIYISSAYFGGHCSLLDIFASGGLMAGLPLTGMFISWIYFGYKNIKLAKRNWENVSLFICVFLFIVGSFANPYFLNGQEISFFIYFIVGLICGDNYELTKNTDYLTHVTNATN